MINDVQALYDKLKIIRKGSGEDFELRASEDEKVWAVRTFLEDPAKPTWAVFAGPDARDSACDLADYEIEDDEAEEDDDEDDEEDD